MSRPLYVVAVTFVVKGGHEAQFLAAALVNAEASLQEAGCRMFDICESTIRSEYLFYELYDDRAAFDFHCQTPHFFAFDRQTQDWVEKKTVVDYLAMATTAGR